MSRHDRDAASLMGGAALILIALSFLLTDLTSLRIDGGWAAPVVLIVVGALGVAASLRRSARPSDLTPSG